MGRIIEARFEDIHPSEDDMTLTCFLDLLSVNLRHLPPPAVREFQGAYILIDGRHRTLMNYVLQKESQPVYVPNGPNDFLIPREHPHIKKSSIKEMNATLKNSWDQSIEGAKAMGMINIPEYFQNLLENRPYMGSVENALEFVEKERPAIHHFYFGRTL